VTSTELLDLVSTNLMALFGFAASNSIALLSLLVAVLVWWQSRKDAQLAMKTAEMSVKPHINLITDSTFSNLNSVFRVDLENNGLGPAFIHDFKVLVDGKEVDKGDKASNLDNALRQLQLPIQINLVMGFVEKQSIRSLASTIVMEIEVSSRACIISKEKIRSELRRLDIIISYKDIYGNLQDSFDSRDYPNKFF
jgi:archaellum component FlaF (FlaF/FlaG flagellin family)